MSETSAVPKSGAQQTRLVGLDAARGLALVGMIIVNVGPTDATSLAHRLYLIPYGRASILFVVIAGIGMGLLASRSLRRPAQDQGLWPLLLWRAGLLIVGGMLLQSLTMEIGVILTLYGILFLLAPLLVRLGDHGLVAAAGLMLIVGPVLVIAYDVATGTDAGGSPPVGPDVPLPDLLLGLLFSGRYPLATWVVPFLVGLRLARCDLTSGTTQRRLMLWGALAAIGGVAASEATRGLLGSAADEGAARLLTGVAHGQMPLWLISSIGGAVAVVAVMTRLGQRYPRAVMPLAECGRLSLTIYVLHVLVLIVVTPPGGFSLLQGLAVSATLIAFALAAGPAWTRVGGPGPLERLMRPPWARPHRPDDRPDATLPTTAPEGSDP